MKKILFIIGSKHIDSRSQNIVEAIVGKNFANRMEQFSYEILHLKDYNVSECVGCEYCFHIGECRYKDKDDLQTIINQINDADIIFWVSPVYLINVPGCMKNLLDRLSIYCHTMGFGGKLCFIIISSSLSGSKEIGNYLKKILSAMGFKILRTYLFTTSKGEENVQYVDKVRDNIFFCLRHNYGVSNAYLEDIFLSNKYYYQEILS